VFLAGLGIVRAQNSPTVSQVLMYSGTTDIRVSPTVTLPRALPSVYSLQKSTSLGSDPNFGNLVSNPSNFGVSRSVAQIIGALNASIATALSIVPLSSPASGVIDRTDPATGARLAESSTLGPIFTERAETIGKGHFYIGFSRQDFHFTKFNGTSLNSLNALYLGGDKTGITDVPTTSPASFSIGMDVRLSQNIAFLTYGVTDRVDVSVGLPMVHASAASRMFNAQMYIGNGFGTNGSGCWCASTFTPGVPTIIQPTINQASASKTGFGDLLLRVKGTVFRTPATVVAIGTDLRFPTGDEQNYLGVGAMSAKPFVAVSFYSRPMAHGIVLSPHFDAGWQFSGKSILGGELQASNQTVNTPTGTVNYAGAPFTTSKGTIPDVFSWAVGAELALGRRNTFIADILGNQIGWINGIPNTETQTLKALPVPTSVNGDESGKAVPTKTDVTGMVSIGRVSFGQYSGSFGYKVKIAGNLVANFNLLLRFDNNGLTARTVPLFGLGYSF
jgi:hypothetical protein